MTKKDLLQVATKIATQAHKGQKIVAMLHDTIEDSDVTPEYLLNYGFPEYIVDAVVSVTKQRLESYTDFVLRAKANPIGRPILLDSVGISTH